VKRKRTINKSKLHMPKPHKPMTPDPTLEEIWGPGGLAEQERLKRPEHLREPEPCKDVRLIMRPFGIGKLIGSD
jgi:hypothetical protein